MHLPPVGLGTMGIDAPETVGTAIDVGYRHLDTAQVYGNEAVVGAAIADGSVPREDLTVATKLWIDSLACEDVRAGTKASLDRLGLDRVEVLYVHRPRGDYEPAETLPAVDAVREAGLTDDVGLSNFGLDQLATARDRLDSTIAANQVEFHPYFQQDELLADAQANDYQLVAYAPLAGGAVFDDPVIADVAARHGTTPAASTLAWLRSYDNVVTIPKASSRVHLEANREAQQVELDEDDVTRIEAIDREVELYPE